MARRQGDRRHAHLLRHHAGGILRLCRRQSPPACPRSRTVLSLAYRLPRSHVDQLLGTVTAYPLTAAFQDAWDNLPAWPYRGKLTRPPYKSLATDLCAATREPISMV